MTSPNRIAALDQLHCYLATVPEDVRAKPSTADRQKHARVFELCVAFELDLILWECLPPASFSSAPLPLQRFMARGGRPRDYGIDCCNLTLDHVAQAKWYKDGSAIGWRDVSTFFALATAVHANTLTLATRPNATVVSLVAALPSIQRTNITDSRVDEICKLAVGPSFATQMQSLDDELAELLGDTSLSDAPSAEKTEPPFEEAKDEMV